MGLWWCGFGPESRLHRKLQDHQRSLVTPTAGKLMAVVFFESILLIEYAKKVGNVLQPHLTQMNVVKNVVNANKRSKVVKRRAFHLAR